MIRTPFVLAVLGLSLLAPRGDAQSAAPAPAQPPAQAPAADAAPAAHAAKPDIYDEHADAKAQIAAALARAGKDNRRVLIQWGANWCGWCHLLHELCASDGEIQHELLYEYDVVLVDVGRMDKAQDVAAGYAADLKGSGLPYLTILAPDGTVLANQATGPLELTDAEKQASGSKLGHDPARVLGFLVKHQAAYLHSQDLYRDALAAAGRDGKRVFLHFGAPWCGWCHKLEGWMAQPRVAELLGKDFVDCKIDTERTLGGGAMLTRIRGSEQGGIPWYQFLADDGAVLADSNDGAAGNIGFPGAPAELAHFREMLRKAAVHLTPADLDELLASLAPPAAPPAAAPAAPTAPHAVPATPAVPTSPAVPASPAPAAPSSGGH